jgi:hypothetical protein
VQSFKGYAISLRNVSSFFRPTPGTSYFQKVHPSTSRPVISFPAREGLLKVLPLTVIVPSSLTVDTEVRNFLELLGEIPRATGASVLVLDHSGKPSADKVRAGITMTPRGASAKHDWADLVMTFEKRDHEARVLRVLRFQKTRFCAQPPALVLDMGTNLVFCASGEEETCPVFTVRQVVADNPGIRASKLYTELTWKTGCSKPTAIHAVKRAETLGYVECREFSSKHKEYHPKGEELVKSGRLTNSGEDKNEDE